MTTTVVNVARREECDVYIGRVKHRTLHWGNPFYFRLPRKSKLWVPDREIAVAQFESWLLGQRDQDVELTRRRWILSHLSELQGKRLGCFCAPKPCHGDVLARMADELGENP